MSDFNERVKDFAIELYKINSIKFGTFELKTGILSPIYCDLRVIISYPKVLDLLVQLLVEKIKSFENYTLLCGVPYTALPVATAMSLRTGVPMVLRRKEAKTYGTKKLIEGTFKVNDTCLIIEDVVTSGSSILETVKDLTDAGLRTTDALVILNREQGGLKLLQENGIRMLSLLTISQLVQYLFEAKCIDQVTVDKVKNYLNETQVDVIPKPLKYDRLKINYTDRAAFMKNDVGKKLLQIMSEKQSSLCVAADLTSSTKILHLAEQLGPHICILKTHIDIIENYSEEFTNQLRTIANTHNFLLMEDRKFADIGKTVSLQLSKGIYQISKWADLITAHSLPGKCFIEALGETEGIKRGIFLVGEMSSAGNLISNDYTAATIKVAQECQDFVVGIVGQSCKFKESPGLLQLTPGIHLNQTGDNLGQQYNTPEYAVLEKGADIGVIGRGITEAEDSVSVAVKYKKLLWEAYLKRLNNTV